MELILHNLNDIDWFIAAVITELMKPESTSNGGQKVMKASERLTKVLSEAEIRSLVEKMEQKNGADV